MWICHNKAFLSIVQDRKNPDKFVVRARRRKHILAIFPDAKIISKKKSDYQFRTFLTKMEVATAIAREILLIDYDNFKNSVRDQDLHYAYMGVWDEMSWLQSRRPWFGYAKPSVGSAFDDLLMYEVGRHEPPISHAPFVEYDDEDERAYPLPEDVK